MIYCDGVHVVSDTSLQELHDWAVSVGIGLHWFHNSRIKHYDIPVRRRGEIFAGVSYAGERGLVVVYMGGNFKTK
jgi:hypothetical protein